MIDKEIMFIMILVSGLIVTISCVFFLINMKCGKRVQAAFNVGTILAVCVLGLLILVDSLFVGIAVTACFFGVFIYMMKRKSAYYPLMCLCPFICLGYCTYPLECYLLDKFVSIDLLYSSPIIGVIGIVCVIVSIICIIKKHEIDYFGILAPILVICVNMTLLNSFVVFLACVGYSVFMFAYTARYKMNWRCIVPLRLFVMCIGNFVYSYLSSALKYFGVAVSITDKDFMVIGALITGCAAFLLFVVAMVRDMIRFKRKMGRIVSKKPSDDCSIEGAQ